MREGDRDERTVLHVAAARGYLEVVGLLAAHPVWHGDAGRERLQDLLELLREQLLRLVGDLLQLLLC